MNKINTNCIVNSILCNSNLKIPLSNSHYLTGKGFLLFNKLACIENNLTCFTNNLKNMCSKNNLLRK